MGVIKYVNLSVDVSKKTRINKFENRKRVPFSGKLVNFVVHFPSGTDNLVGVFCGLNQTHLVPIDGELLMSETSVVFPVGNLKVDVDDVVWAGVSNYSDSKDYHVEIYAGIECECEG